MATFETNFKKTFFPIDTASASIAKLQTLTQKGSIKKYITNFRTAAVRSSITQDAALIEFFSTALKPALVHCIMGMDTVPTTIAEWYEKAAQFDNQWMKAHAITTRGNNGGSSNIREGLTPTLP